MERYSKPAIETKRYSMRIEHLAIWVQDLEKSKAFYSHYFGAQAGEKYHNPAKEFTSYFLSFETGSRLELMHKPTITFAKSNDQDFLGIAHFAISVGTKEKVDSLTQILRDDGYRIIGAPRTTGDGYYESVVLDPEGNSIEITI